MPHTRCPTFTHHRHFSYHETLPPPVVCWCAVPHPTLLPSAWKITPPCPHLFAPTPYQPHMPALFTLVVIEPDTIPNIPMDVVVWMDGSHRKKGKERKERTGQPTCPFATPPPPHAHAPHHHPTSLPLPPAPTLRTCLPACDYRLKRACLAPHTHQPSTWWAHVLAPLLRHAWPRLRFQHAARAPHPPLLTAH